MEDNATPTPLIVEPQIIPLDEIAQWSEDNRDTLNKLLAEADQLLRANYLDSRAVHLGALITGLRALA